MESAMELIFEPNNVGYFIMEVTCFDSVLYIKKQIEEKAGYPASGLTLIFNGEVLPDDLKVHSSGFRHQSRITLLFSKISLLVSLPNRTIVPLPIDLTDTILQLKYKIVQSIIEGDIPADRLRISANGIELLDERTIQDCGLLNKTEVVVRLRPLLKVTVVFRGQNIPMVVYPSDMVWELKNKLANTDVDLPPDGYFFIHNQQVMDCNRSFTWHDVTEGDTIHMSDGDS